jgi:hypothetical protein
MVFAEEAIVNELDNQAASVEAAKIQRELINEMVGVGAIRMDSALRCVAFVVYGRERMDEEVHPVANWLMLSVHVTTFVQPHKMVANYAGKESSPWDTEALSVRCVRKGKTLFLYSAPNTPDNHVQVRW